MHPLLHDYVLLRNWKALLKISNKEWDYKSVYYFQCPLKKECMNCCHTGEKLYVTMYRHRNAALRHKWGGGQYCYTARDEGSTCIVARAARLQRGVLDPLPSHIQHKYTDTYVERNSARAAVVVSQYSKGLGLAINPDYKNTHTSNTHNLSVQWNLLVCHILILNCVMRATKNKKDEKLPPVP